MFVHLAVHTEYSVVDGLSRPETLIERACALEQPALAITDVANLFGAVKFFKAAVQKGLKPIIGVEIPTWDERFMGRILLYAQDEQGYRNLCQVVSQCYETERRAGLPCLELSRLHDVRLTNVLGISAGRWDSIGQLLLRNQLEQAEFEVSRWKKILPAGFYLSASQVGWPDEALLLEKTLQLSDVSQIPVLALNHIRFALDREFEAHEAKCCIGSGQILNDKNRHSIHTRSQYLRSSEQMQSCFSHVPDLVNNTVLFAKRCNFWMNLGRTFLPLAPVPEGEKIDNYLSDLSSQGLTARLTKVPQAQHSLYWHRLKTELDIIISMGFSSYFLIVADFIAWAKSENIPVGPGRGSGAGSLVAYALSITSLDPIVYQLLFERFLNPERVSMPDFDIDFCMDQRDRVIEYVTLRYGKQKVSQIITFGTMAAKAVLRDVGRILGYPYGLVDKLAKLIPNELGITLEKALQQEPLLQAQYQQDADVQAILDLAKPLEGVVRNVGKHAGGVVIAPTDLHDFTALYREHPDLPAITHLDKDDIESVGLIKFDFLGLRTLTIMDWACRTINQWRSLLEQNALELQDLPLDDPLTYQLIQNAQTSSVFQLESRGMKALTARLLPSTFEDLIALVALFRPGPLQSGMVDDFIARKQGLAPVDCLHPQLESVLLPTYGVIVYQEQVMQIAQILAGFSLGEADLLRRAMGKKKADEMRAYRHRFVDGAQNAGFNSELADRIFDLMEKFAAYGFNKSHSAAYALIAYQTAWLKAHYPAPFMAAVLSCEMDHTDKVVLSLQECRAMQLQVLPPNIHTSEHYFVAVSEQQLSYGLGAIKGLGEGAVQAILQARRERGEFKDLLDFLRRVDAKKISKRVVESLLYAGAFDVWGISRWVLAQWLEPAMREVAREQIEAKIGQLELLTEEKTFEFPVMGELSELELLRREHAVLGHYFSNHPVNLIAAEAQALGLTQEANVSGEWCYLGTFESLRLAVSKSGKRFAILNLSLPDRVLEVFISVEMFEKLKPQALKEDTVMVVKGTVDGYQKDPRLKAHTAKTFDVCRQEQAKTVLLTVEKSDMDWDALTGLLSRYPGSVALTVLFFVEDFKAYFECAPIWRVQPCEALLEALRPYGKASVCYQLPVIGN